MHILALDHYYDQDLSALESYPGLIVRRIPFTRLRGPAIRMMGEEVARDMGILVRPELLKARRHYANWLANEVRKMYLEQPFDLIVLPSDSFFYVQDLPEAAHALGIPVVVVQKETIISPDTLEEYSVLVGACAPFVSECMTVCSQQQRAFWLRAGADPSKILVTGQPRFDIYAKRIPPPDGPKRRVLFLSYELDAYEPGVGGGMGRRTWESLRSATERALVDSARAGCEITVKLHPQQVRVNEMSRLRLLAGDLWEKHFFFADPEADTRDLMIQSHAVVGFQTTGLYEAVAAGRAVIYAAWGEAFERHKERLIPYHTVPETCLLRAHNPEHLVTLLTSALSFPRATECLKQFEGVMGPVDGKATQRVVKVLGEVVAAWPPGAQRKDLDGKRARFAAQFLVRSVASEAMWWLAEIPAAIAGRRLGARARRRVAADSRKLAFRGLRGKTF